MSLMKNISRAVGGVAKAYGVAIATAYGGPAAGALASSFIGSSGGGSAPGLPTQAPWGGTGPTSMPGGMMGTAGVIPYAGRAIAAAGRYLVSARGVVSTIAGRIIGVMRGTSIMRNPAVAKFAQSVGIQAAATALGITAVEIAQMVMESHASSSRRSRRGRGITGRDVKVTRRTIHKIRGIEHALTQSGICRPRARARK